MLMFSATGCNSASASRMLQVKKAFGAKHVIRVCSSEYKKEAFAAARKLIAEADRIKAQVDLRGASIALDDCYQVRALRRTSPCSFSCQHWCLQRCRARAYTQVAS